MTLGELIRETARRFTRARLHYGHGTGNAHDEAAFLVLRGLGLPFDADLKRPVQAGKIEALVKKRIQQRIPAAYLLSEAWLDGLKFYVDRRVIVPRSHIAFLLQDIRPVPRRVLDLCTGSGCLAILAARAFPKARVDASDISAHALAVAKRNVRTYDLKISLIKADLLDGLGQYDLILSNPPYVGGASMRALPAEYRYEPGLALAGGRDGLELVHRILAAAPAHLTPRGRLICEIGAGRRALERALPATPFRWLRDEVFLLERARMAGASRSAPRRARGA